eukprot:TRINITY_DN5022_c0_g1_i1.p1 TRINITY_DN5022_c0_g1~~TRINITY_DN5022_c0_g1_i1.p1  ORF type:complete len:827 (+),score=183.93 TRINITY_DN5022_c0_g1_i1:49-2529(+)
MDDFNPDVLRIIFSHLFQLKKLEKKEKDGLFYAFIPHPSNLDEFTERCKLDSLESIDWANVRRVNKNWLKIADECFHRGGHITPLLLQIDNESELKKIIERDEYFLPLYLQLSVQSEDPEKAEKIFETWPHLMDEFVKTVRYPIDSEDEGMKFHNNQFNVLMSGPYMQKFVNDPRLKHEDLASLAAWGSLFQNKNFVTCALKSKRLEDPTRLGGFIKDSRWLEGLKILIEEEGINPIDLVGSVLDPGISSVVPDAEFMEILAFHPKMNARGTHIMILSFCVTEGYLATEEWLLNRTKLIDDQVKKNLIDHLASNPTIDVNGDAFRILLKHSNVPLEIAYEGTLITGSIPKLVALLESGNKQPPTDLLYRASSKDQFDIMKELLRRKMYTPVNVSSSLKKAIINNETEVKELLFEAYVGEDKPALSIEHFLPLELAQRYIPKKLKDPTSSDAQYYLEDYLLASTILEDGGVCKYLLGLLNTTDSTSIYSYSLVSSSFYGRMDQVKLLLEDGRARIHWRNYSCVRAAKEEGHDEIYQYLLERGGRLDPIIHPLYYPSRRGLMEVHLQRDSETKAYMIELPVSHAMRAIDEDAERAVLEQNQQILSFLVSLSIVANSSTLFNLLVNSPRVDPSIDHDAALCQSAKSGNMEFMKALLNHPRVDPGGSEGEPLRIAANSNNLEMVNLLLNTGRANLAISNALCAAATVGAYDIFDLFLSRKEIDLKLWGRPAFTVLLNNDNRALKRAKILWDYIKEGYLEDENLPKNTTFEQVVNLKVERPPWYQSHWFLPVECALIGVAISYFYFASRKSTLKLPTCLSASVFVLCNYYC